MEFRILRPEEREHWADFCHQNFDVPAEYFLRHYDNDPWADPEAIFTAWEDDVLYGSVRVLTREVYLKGEKVRCGGIGEVCTAKEARGKGVSTTLLRMAIAYMEEKRLPISMLFTGTHHHYAHLGWFTAPRRYVHWDVTDAAGEGTLTEASAELLTRLHDRFAPAVDGVIVRNRAYWERWVAGENWQTAVWTADGEPTAYAVYRAGAEGEPLQISECLGSSHTQTGALLHALCKRYAADPRVFIASSCAPVNTDYTESYGTMARLNLPFVLGGQRIESTADLAAAMANSTFFSVDSY